MASALYDKAREKFLGGDLDWDAHTFKCFLLDSALYTPNLATHEFLSDVPAGARFGNSGGQTRADAPVFATKTKVAGVADADDIVILTIPAGTSLEYLLIFRDDGVADSSSPLVALIDTASGLPVTTNGADITIAWSNTTNKIFKL